MPWKFNPFSGTLDQAGSGGGASYLDGEVAAYSDLSLDAGVAPLNTAWLVRTASGVWPVSRKQGGIYIRTATAGVSRDADYTYAGTMPDVFSDSQFLLYDNSDTSRNLAFDLSGISTGTTRTLTVPNSSGTISLTGHTHIASDIIFGQFANNRINWASPDPIGSSVPSTGAFTTLAATGTTELVNGASAAGPFLMYRSFTNASNYERGFMRWDSGILRIGTERLGGSGNIDFELTRMGSAWVRLINSGLNIDTALRVNLGQPVFVNGGFIQMAASNGTASVILDRDGAGIFAQRNATDAQEYRLYGTYTSATNYQRMTVKSVKQTLSALSGASATTTGTFIPDGAVVVGVTTRVATLLTGAAGYTIGDGTDADRWGDITGTAVGTTSDNRDWTAGTIECFTAGGNITLTAKTSNFTAGAIEICVFYLAGEAD